MQQYKIIDEFHHESVYVLSNMLFRNANRDWKY